VSVNINLQLRHCIQKNSKSTTLQYMTMYSEYFELHFASIRSHNSWSDNVGSDENLLLWCRQDVFSVKNKTKTKPLFSLSSRRLETKTLVSRT